jgi:hypothetical protein
MLPIRKIYIDSRFKSSDSESDANFKIDLPVSMLMPPNTGFYIDDVCIPVSWYTVDSNRNNNIYFKVNGIKNKVSIPKGDYNLTSLNNAIVSALNAVYPSVFTSSPDLTLSKIKIIVAEPYVFELLTDAKAIDVGFPTPLYSINALLKNTVADTYVHSYPYISGYIDLLPFRNVYITCSGLGSFNTMSVSGERQIIKKVPINASYGEVIFGSSNGLDYLDCSKQTLSRLEFQLKDVFGNVLNLNNNHWSFSIVFGKVQEF